MRRSRGWEAVPSRQARAATSIPRTACFFSSRSASIPASLSRRCSSFAVWSSPGCRASDSTARSHDPACRKHTANRSFRRLEDAIMTKPQHASPDVEVSVALGEDFLDIREAVRRICKDFPGNYWRELDDRSGYPTEFVEALTKSGFLGAL